MEQQIGCVFEVFVWWPNEDDSGIVREKPSLASALGYAECLLDSGYGDGVKSEVVIRPRKPRVKTVEFRLLVTS